MSDGDKESIEEMTERRRGRGNLSQAEIDRRNEELVRDRLRGQGWEHLATKHDLSVRQCQHVYQQWREKNPASYRGREPIAIVQEMLERLDSIGEQLAEVADDATVDTTRISAINSQMTAMTRMAELMQATGILPHNLGTLRVELDVQATALKVVQILNEYGIDPTVKREIVEALKGGVSQPQLPAASG